MVDIAVTLNRYSQNLFSSLDHVTVSIVSLWIILQLMLQSSPWLPPLKLLLPSRQNRPALISWTLCPKQVRSATFISPGGSSRGCVCDDNHKTRDSFDLINQSTHHSGCCLEEVRVIFGLPPAVMRHCAFQNIKSSFLKQTDRPLFNLQKEKE